MVIVLMLMWLILFYFDIDGDDLAQTDAVEYFMIVIDCDDDE